MRVCIIHALQSLTPRSILVMSARISHGFPLAHFSLGASPGGAIVVIPSFMSCQDTCTHANKSHAQISKSMTYTDNLVLVNTFFPKEDTVFFGARGGEATMLPRAIRGGTHPRGGKNWGVNKGVGAVCLAAVRHQGWFKPGGK